MKNNISKIIRAANIIEKNKISKANYMFVSMSKINEISKELNLSSEETIILLEKYFKPNN
jgi:hypothetical protein